MLSRSADVAVRLALGLLGLAAMVGVFQLLDSDGDLSPVVRVAFTIPLGGVFVVALSAVSELRDKYEDRQVLRFRRWGRRPIVLSDVGGASVTGYLRPQVDSTAPARRFPIRLRGTLVTFAVGSLIAGVSWIGAVHAAEGKDVSEIGVLLAFALPIGLWLSIRALIRVALSYRAVEVDSSAITLGIALGFVWPVRLPLGEIKDVLIYDAGRGAETIIGMRDGRSFRIDGRQLRNEAEFSAWWAENTMSDQSFEGVAASSQIELEPPTAHLGVGAPDAQRVEDVRTAMRRRTMVTISSLVFAVLVAAAVGYTYVEVRVENDLLAESGRKYVAVVTDVDRSSRGLDDISVRFVANGNTYERTITSPWFRGFRSDLKGETVGVLFDPSQEGIARLPDARNYSSLLRFSFLASPSVLMLAVMSYRNTRWHMLALNRGQWKRARVRIGGAAQRMADIRRDGDADTHQAHVFIHGMNGYGGGEAWISGHDRGLVVIFDDGDHWLPALLGKKSPLRQSAGT